MSIQVDTWGGDLHTNHVSRDHFTTWNDAASFMHERIEEGHLCNVLHTDFKAPEGRAEETAKAMTKQLGDM